MPLTVRLQVLKSLTAQITFAMLLGGVAGILLGPNLDFLGELGKLIIQLIKAAAIPLVFFAIIDAALSTNMNLKSAPKFVLIILINSFFATLAGLLLSNYFQAGTRLNIDFETIDKTAQKSALITKKYNIAEILAGYLPESFIEPFAQNSVIGVVIISILIGSSARYLKNKGMQLEGIHAFESLITVGLKIFEIILIWIVRLVPLAVFGVMCKTVGQYGFSPFKALALYVLIAFIGFAFQILVVYQIWIGFVCGMRLKKFWIVAKEAVVYAFGINSSLATLPITLNALNTLGVSKASSRLGACIGTNLNNDGILLYECVAVIFVTQAYGIHLPFEVQIFIIILCLLAAVGVAGVPEAGIVSLSLVLTAVNLPLEILGLLLTVDWLIARGRSVVNVLSDMTVSIALDGKKASQ